jgi:hypothetical protein
LDLTLAQAYFFHDRSHAVPRLAALVSQVCKHGQNGSIGPGGQRMLQNPFYGSETHGSPPGVPVAASTNLLKSSFYRGFVFSQIARGMTTSAVNNAPFAPLHG